VVCGCWAAIETTIFVCGCSAASEIATLVYGSWAAIVIALSDSFEGAHIPPHSCRHGPGVWYIYIYIYIYIYQDEPPLQVSKYTMVVRHRKR
jgi:hypothetical protein